VCTLSECNLAVVRGMEDYWISLGILENMIADIERTPARSDILLSRISSAQGGIYHNRSSGRHLRRRLNISNRLEMLRRLFAALSSHHFVLFSG